MAEVNTPPNPIPQHIARAALHALDHSGVEDTALFLDIALSWMPTLPADYEDLWDAKVALECACALSTLDPSLYAEGAIEREIEEARSILERACGS